MPGPRRDPFYRRWMMALPEDLDDPRLYRLPIADRLIWKEALLFALKSSKLPTHFIHHYDEAMTLEDIADGIRVPLDLVEAAFGRFRTTKPSPLMSYDAPSRTWGFASGEYERRSVDGEKEKLRIANAERQKRWRRRHKGGDEGDAPRVLDFPGGRG